MQVATYNCSLCGDPDNTYQDRLLCSRCSGWQQTVLQDKRETRWSMKLIIGGDHYMACGLKTDTRFCGNGGRVYLIRNLESGEVITTNDLWHQGSLPDWLVTPDNAEFLMVDGKPYKRRKPYPLNQVKLSILRALQGGSCLYWGNHNVLLSEANNLRRLHSVQFASDDILEMEQDKLVRSLSQHFRGDPGFQYKITRHGAAVALSSVQEKALNL